MHKAFIFTRSRIYHSKPYSTGCFNNLWINFHLHLLRGCLSDKFCNLVRNVVATASTPIINLAVQIAEFEYSTLKPIASDLSNPNKDIPLPHSHFMIMFTYWTRPVIVNAKNHLRTALICNMHHATPNSFQLSTNTDLNNQPKFPTESSL